MAAVVMAIITVAVVVVFLGSRAITLRGPRASIVSAAWHLFTTHGMGTGAVSALCCSLSLCLGGIHLR